MPSLNLRIVPDTGFYIAAALEKGYCRDYLVGRGSQFLTYSLFTSEAILLEVQYKLEQKFHLERPDVVISLRQIRNVVKLVIPTRKLSVVRDPDDDKILECAIEAHADLIVTFDKDLLILKEFKGIKIIHPNMLQYMFPQKLR